MLSLSQVPLSKQELLGMLCPCPCCKPKGKQRVPAAAVTTQGRKLECPQFFQQVVRTSTLCEPEGLSPV